MGYINPLSEGKHPRSDNLLLGSSQNLSWRNIALFVALTFGMSWMLALLIYLKGGLMQGGAVLPPPAISGLLSLMMLFPAFSAIFLQLFIFKESPLYFKTYHERPRFFYYFFLIFTILYAVVSILAFLDALTFALSAALKGVLAGWGLLMLAFLRRWSGKTSFARAGLSFGPLKYYILYGLLMVGLWSGEVLLNIGFNLGGFVITKDAPVLVILGLQAVLWGPLLSLLVAFGEEYGWRGYLQNELTKLGRIRGIALVGLIWGIWHGPIIAMGFNYPDHPVLGIMLFTVIAIVLAFIWGFAYLQSRSVWLVSFLHGLNNLFVQFLLMEIYAPTDSVFSFGAGIYGLLIWIPAVLLLLRRLRWCNLLVTMQEPSAVQT